MNKRWGFLMLAAVLTAALAGCSGAAGDAPDSGSDAPAVEEQQEDGGEASAEQPAEDEWSVEACVEEGTAHYRQNSAYDASTIEAIDPAPLLASLGVTAELPPGCALHVADSVTQEDALIWVEPDQEFLDAFAAAMNEAGVTGEYSSVTSAGASGYGMFASDNDTRVASSMWSSGVFRVVVSGI